MSSSATNSAPPQPIRLFHAARRPAGLVLVPLLLLAALALGDGYWAVPVAIALPLTVLAALPRRSSSDPSRRDAVTGLAQRGAIVDALDSALLEAAGSGGSTGALVLEIDCFKRIEERYDRAAVERILKVTGDRLQDNLRDCDLPARLEGPTFAVALAAVRRLDMESAIQLAGRVQRAMAEPISVDGLKVHVSVSIGFALASRLDRPSGDRLMQAATLAVIEAQRNGPAAIRSYSAAMDQRIRTRNNLAEEVSGALDRGDICAYFQPQISVKTGAITGVEALARWHHPDRGLIPPAEFIPALEQTGLMGRLGEIMVQDGLNALRLWDSEGLVVPQVGVNFSHAELGDPSLVDRIGWELDRFDLQPDRLVVEVLETVVANRAEDMVIRNLAGLARLGCCLDLDDFGTGHAAITSIRRLSIHRIKIDRSFITRIDADPEQQKMVSAILTMAERLGLDTLAEGVETEAEHAMLARLGCGHVQGFGIARPMPRDEADAWIRAYRDRDAGPAPLQRQAI